MKNKIKYFLQKLFAPHFLFSLSTFFSLSLFITPLTVNASPYCDLSLAVTAKSVIQKMSLGKRIAIIDVRSQEDFERLRIPGSINLPLHAIKTKSYLKQTPIVLLDEGFSYNRLSGVCKILNQEDFNAKVLYGGLLAWDDFGGRLDGDMHLLRGHRRVTFEEFFSEKDYGNQLVVYVGKEASDDSDLPAGIHLSMGSDPKKWAAQLKPHLKNAVTYPYVSVVLISKDDLDRDRVLTLAASANVRHWFLLEGGITGYLNKLINIALAAKPKDQHIKIIGACPQCKNASDSDSHVDKSKKHDVK